MSNCRNCGSPPSPTPYYEEVKDTVQNHTNILRDTQYAAGVIVNDEFQIPAVGEDIQVRVNNLTDVVIGTYLNHPKYGYLKIVYWDSCAGKIGLLNEGLTGTAAPGSTVPECTAFIPSARPCCADQDNFQLFPFLAKDFTAPAVSDQVTLQVTSTFGLVQGTIVRIGTCLYFLDNINSSLEIVVTNQGTGCTPGSLVEARDANGTLQYLITSSLVTACAASAIDQGKIVICVGADQHILDGDFVGQVPVLQDPATDEVKFQLLDTTVRMCTVLSAPVSITPGIGTYVLPVADATGFANDDILEVQSSDLRFQITSIVVNDLHVTTSPDPAGITATLQAGEWVCKITCCELLQDEIDSLVFNLDADYLRLDGTNEASLAANTFAFDKLQTVNTDRLIGRDTVGAGNIEELTVGNGIAFTGSGGIGIPTNALALSQIQTVTSDRLIGRDTVGTGSLQQLTVGDGLGFTGSLGIGVVTEGITEPMLAPDAASRSVPLCEFAYLKVAAGVVTSDPAGKYTGQYLTTPKVIMPKAGKITHISAMLLAPPGVGQTFIALTFKNGVSSGYGITIANSAVIDSGSNAMGAIQSFVAEDALSVKIDATAGMTPGFEAIIVLWGHFIE